MTREEAIKLLCVERSTIIEVDGNKGAEKMLQAYDMAIEALQADATVAKIQIDDIDKAKTSSQLLDDLAVDMVKAMGKRIVEVVRCKDCRHQEFYINDTESFHCRKSGVVNMHMDDGDGDFFCKYGERREP